MASIICQTSSNENTIQSEYIGNRGITAIIDNVYTANLQNAIPSNNATYSEINMASYQTAVTGAYTVWLKGFLTPGKTSKYEFEIVSTGTSILYISTDSLSANKVYFKKLLKNMENSMIPCYSHCKHSQLSFIYERFSDRPSSL